MKTDAQATKMYANDSSFQRYKVYAKLRIFDGVRWRGGATLQWGCGKERCSDPFFGNSETIIADHIIAFRLFTDSKMYDLE